VDPIPAFDLKYELHVSSKNPRSEFDLNYKPRISSQVITIEFNLNSELRASSKYPMSEFNLNSEPHFLYKNIALPFENADDHPVFESLYDAASG
jgi:hypothetical protein